MNSNFFAVTKKGYVRHTLTIVATSDTVSVVSNKSTSHDTAVKYVVNGSRFAKTNVSGQHMELFDQIPNACSMSF